MTARKTAETHGGPRMTALNFNNQPSKKRRCSVVQRIEARRAGRMFSSPAATLTTRNPGEPRMRALTGCLTLLSLAAALFPGGLRAQSAAPATIGCSNDGLGRGADALVGAITGGLLGTNTRRSLRRVASYRELNCPIVRHARPRQLCSAARRRRSAASAQHALLSARAGVRCVPRSTRTAAAPAPPR